MRALILIVSLLTIGAVWASPSSAEGTFNIIPSQPKPVGPERKPYEGVLDQVQHRVQIYDTETAITSANAWFVTWGWKVNLRAWPGASCYVEVHFLDEEGYEVSWTNDNTVVPRNKNGFTNARGSMTLSRGQAHRVDSTTTNARCI